MGWVGEGGMWLERDKRGYRWRENVFEKDCFGVSDGIFVDL